jgi:hypothetical protein
MKTELFLNILKILKSYENFEILRIIFWNFWSFEICCPMNKRFTGQFNSLSCNSLLKTIDASIDHRGAKHAKILYSYLMGVDAIVYSYLMSVIVCRAIVSWRLLTRQ